MCDTNKGSDNRITTKDIHDTYWRCRDFELSHLWQRSIFLSAFLIICFTGYGAVIVKMIDAESGFDKINLIALLISTVGIIFSCLWIMMGKGSKAWYERYENAISAFEASSEYATQKATKIGGFRYEGINDYEYSSIKQNIFKGDGGAFSVSKINIAIGQITIIIWFAVFLFHSLIIFYGKDIVDSNIIKYVIFGLSIIGLSVFFTLIFCKKYHWLYSSTLKKEE